MSFLVAGLLLIGIGLLFLFGAPFVFKNITLSLTPGWQDIPPRLAEMYILFMRLIGLGAMIAGILFVWKTFL